MSEVFPSKVVHQLRRGDDHFMIYPVNPEGQALLTRPVCRVSSQTLPFVAEEVAARLCHVWNNFDSVVEALVDAGGWIDSLDASVMCNTNRGFLVSQKIKSALRLARPAAEGVDRG